MNQTFNLKRFYKFLKTETLINKNAIIRALLGLLLMFLAAYYFDNYILGGAFSIGTDVGMSVETVHTTQSSIDSIYLFILQIMVIMLPFGLYKKLYDKVKSVKYAMLPASQLEKVMSAITLTSIVIPIILTLAFGLMIFTTHLITSATIKITFSNYFDYIFEAIQLQSLLFLGFFWFKRNKFIKIIIAIIVLFVLNIVFNNFSFDYQSIPIFNFISNNKNTILTILFPLVPWIISYKRFTKTQI